MLISKSSFCVLEDKRRDCEIVDLMIFAEEVFSSGRRDSCLLLAAAAMRELCDNWQRGDKCAETKQGGTSVQSIFVQRGQVGGGQVGQVWVCRVFLSNCFL